MELLQHTIANIVDPEEIMRIAFRIPIKKAHIDRIQHDYYENMLDNLAER